MKKGIVILATIVASTLLATMSGCGPSSNDLEWEATIKGYWKPINEETGELCTSIPYYHFGDSANGATKYYKYTKTDTMKWEIRRKQMNVYYSEAVKGYNVGYNQYNSRSLMHIRGINENEVKMSQLYNSGFQSDYKLVRITPEEFYSAYNDTATSSEPQHIDDTF
ncbi:MAG: hypothetical protein J5709_04180 [Bacteroidales bacterium]|nr:hypothetical protein [Bacteroidales bacterium]